MNLQKDQNYYKHAKIKFLEMLPSLKGRFLEVGCGEGSTLEYIRSRGADYVAGVDINAEAIAAAAGRGLDLSLAADVEKDALPFSPREFDVIILADVLEHLVEPWETLKKLAGYLKDDGYVLISMPNVRHYRVVRDLVLHDKWEYEDSGILDSTHMRFFTLKETKKLLDFAGLDISRLGWRIHAGSLMKLMNAMLFNSLRPFLVFQYHILAVKKGTNLRERE